MRIKWTDRRFSFDFPAGIYPEMIERIRGTPARLEELFAGLSPETLTAQIDGRWSMQENAGHLLDLESLVSQRIDEYLAANSALHAADMSNRKTYDANHNEVTAESILKAFRAARHEIVNRLESFDAEIFERSALHPRLNVPMRLVDMLFFQAEHDDYHLARISEIKKIFHAKTQS
jgi:hypothetical protein